MSNTKHGRRSACWLFFLSEALLWTQHLLCSTSINPHRIILTLLLDINGRKATCCAIYCNWKWCATWVVANEKKQPRKVVVDHQHCWTNIWTDLLDKWTDMLIHLVAKMVERQHKDLTLCCHLEGMDGSGGGLQHSWQPTQREIGSLSRDVSAA